MKLKTFIKYFDDMNKLFIYDWNKEKLTDTNLPKEVIARKCLLFEGYTFDKGAKKKLKELYRKGYVLERNDDGMAVMLFPYQNEHGAIMCNVQINVCLPRRKNDTV